MCLSIAFISITAVNAQDEAQDLKAYQQKQEQELQQSIRTQTQRYSQEAATRMQAMKLQFQNDLEARRSQLMRRPDNMVPYKGN